MITKKPIIISKEKENKLLKYFADNRNVTCVVLFGSYGTKDYSLNSDIDFGILYSKYDLYIELQTENDISKILETDKVDIVNLNKAPLVFQYNVISKGKVIYESDKDVVSDFIEKIYINYVDYKYDYLNYCKDYDYSLKESYKND